MVASSPQIVVQSWKDHAGPSGPARIVLCRVIPLLSLWSIACLDAAESNPTDARPSSSSVLPADCPVAVDHAYLRAGPGAEYYPTERIGRGERVEVWALEPSGWCAIRPVRGSFSWLRAADVEREPSSGGEQPPVRQGSDGEVADDHEGSSDERSDVGVVVVDGAVSRIGSQLNELRHVAQVRLEAGERVRIIDEIRVTEGRHVGLWVRIQPPAGEFRWVSAADLVLPADLVPARNAQDSTDATLAGGQASPSLREPGLLPGAFSEPIPQAPPTGIDAVYDTADMPPPVSTWTARGTGILDRDQTVPRPVSGLPLRSAEDEIGDIDLA
ncbi:MAG: hypothetical protein ACKOCN_03960, partial [Planctomycetaceae bacterium]